MTLLEHLQGTCDQLSRVLTPGEVANHINTLFNATPVESSRVITRAKLRAMKNAVNSTIFDDDGKHISFIIYIFLLSGISCFRDAFLLFI